MKHKNKNKNKNKIKHEVGAPFVKKSTNHVLNAALEANNLPLNGEPAPHNLLNLHLVHFLPLQAVKRLLLLLLTNVTLR